MSDAYDHIARYYDLVDPADEADIGMYDSYARRSDQPVLELGCGTGRVALALARAGHEVWGVERSPAMLERARQRAGTASLPISWIEGDAQSIRLPVRCGLVFWAADGFLHVPDTESQIEALQTAANHLAPEGRLVIDLPAPAGVWADWQPGVRPLELLWSGPAPAGGTLHYFTSVSMQAVDQTRAVTHLFDEADEHGRVMRVTASFRLRFIFPAEARLLVRSAGLILENVFGGYDLDQFDETSERMILVVRA